MYQVVTKNDTVAYVQARHEGSVGPDDFKVSHRADPNDWVEEIEEALDRVLAEWRARNASKYNSDQARDEHEGNLAVVLHQGLCGLPATILTDRDFWRFCSVRLYDFIVWRQPTKTATALLPYFGAQSNGLGRDCVPHRMFDRAHIAKAGGESAGDTDPYAMARFGAADVWKSHILRVANGNAPVIVHAMLSDVRSGSLKTDVVRPFVKNLRRVRANVLFEVLDGHQARDLVDRETARTLAAGATLDSDSPSD